MMRMIRELCDVEEDAADLTYRERYRLRQERSRPVLERIKAWVEQRRAEELFESRFKKALNYVHNQWEALTRYLEDGRLRMDNNPSESEFHVWGTTRRNHLFWGASCLPSGLVLLSLIRTCRMNNLDPYAYLSDVIRLASSGELSGAALTPQRWAERKAREKAAEVVV